MVAENVTAEEREVMTDSAENAINKGEGGTPAVRGKWWRFRPTVEPLVLLFMFSYIITHSVIGALFLEHICGSSKQADCTSDQIAYSSTLTMWKNIIEAVVPAIVSLFLGTWSDKFGRRPIFIWSFSGNIVAYGLTCGLAAIPDLQAEWLLLPSIVSTFSGGMMNLMAVANVYIADVSPVGQKELRLGILDAAQYSAMMLGSGLSAPITTGLKYSGVYGLSAGCMVVALIYTIFLLPETMPPYQQPEGESCGCCGGMFRPQMVREALHTSFQKRPHHGRSTIFIVILVVVTGVLISQGEGNVSFQFNAQKFHWSVQEVQLYGFYGNGTTAIGTLLGVLLFVRWLKLSDAWIALITFSCKITASILFALSPQSWFLYLGGAIGSLGGMVWVLARAMLTRLVAKDEIGKVFALAVTLEAVTPLVAAPMYTAVFTETIDSFPGAFHLLSAGILVFDLAILLLGTFLNRGARKEEQQERKQEKSSIPA